ncbi:RNA polymerase sigma factor [Paucibacter sp. JuS9]|uniref:RNA polymerase sigma factor n=1 Tax=Roseateles TaxID=93681 RepID=UPI002FE535DD
MSLLDIYRARRRALERYVQRLLGNADEAAEVSQEAFLRVYAAELGDQTPVSEALLYTVARNLALSELRKRTSRATDAVGDWDDLRVEDTGPSVETLLQNRQRVAAVEAAMERMAPKCLEVFRLRKIDNLSHAEIASQLGISTKTVERHITRALELCHEAMAEHDGLQRKEVR